MGKVDLELFNNSEILQNNELSEEETRWLSLKFHFQFVQAP